jgi:hypothetical protein
MKPTSNQLRLPGAGAAGGCRPRVLLVLDIALFGACPPLCRARVQRFTSVRAG